MISDEELNDAHTNNEDFYYKLTFAMMRSVQLAADRYGSIGQATIATGKLAVRLLDVMKGEPVYVQMIALESLLRAHISAATEPPRPVNPYQN